MATHPYPRQVRTEAVRLLLTGHDVRAVGLRLGVPYRTVKNWQGAANKRLRSVLETTPEGAQVLELVAAPPARRVDPGPGPFLEDCVITPSVLAALRRAAAER